MKLASISYRVPYVMISDKWCALVIANHFPTHHRQSIEYQRSVNLIGTWLISESISKVSESANT